ncbi:hypothetical protein [Dermacoccus nishinomiyaensis]|uniref:hypothetical protein n=1 Tax=Dermacoccus nishinomiyaensis TaxID=1274 RepID=UPI00248DEC30|nr:hypothetical protein [Dermacoccus nishinomiyaensis]
MRAFCDYICSPHYGWVDECMERFGTHPVQVCHEWNTLAHLQDYEGKPGRRPLTRSELQRLLDHADAEVTRLLDERRKGEASRVSCRSYAGANSRLRLA